MPPDFSIVIPAYDEEWFLHRALDSARAAVTAVAEGLGMRGEVVVVDNNSRDGTADVARDGGADVVVFEPVNQISRARNAGARAAQGLYLVFLDADTILPAALLNRALAGLRDGSLCGGGVRIDSDEPFPWLVRKLLALWNRLSLRRQLAAGSFVFCRSDAFDEVGGFDEKVYAGEEIWLSLRLRRWGRDHGMAFQVFDGPPVQTSARKGQWFGGGTLSLQLLVLTLFPWATRFRWLCWTWYRRPEG
jgi:glycosyltransferase involved in cell wall biosynthesis